MVRKQKNENAEDYEVYTDFYKAVREGIVDMHKKEQPKSALDAILNGLSDKRKQRAYAAIIAGYKRFLGRKKVSWFPPPKDDWTHAGLAVRLNPEVGLVINGERHAIKLYMREKPKLKKANADIITHLIDFALAPGKRNPPRFCVLDVRHGHLFTAPENADDLMTIVRGEAACFAEMYRGA
ncbi:MAG: hypothetical protein IIA33_09455 [Planctomycetes bacterium]|nr:hypothetical protein [Planctomycetota bacterium]